MFGEVVGEANLSLEWWKKTQGKSYHEIHLNSKLDFSWILGLDTWEDGWIYPLPIFDGKQFI